ncbi:MAG: hypothetical protein HC831_11720, partial [Chloroflexia bacterium]|nr:hypothetical protein [Chloroflexia bacterium]
GSIISFTVRSEFNQGSINPQYIASSDKRSGLPVSYTYFGAQIAGNYGDSSLINDRNITGYKVYRGNQSWQSYVSYSMGVQPYDSKGNPYNSPWPAGSTSTKSTSFEGVFPLYGTTANIGSLTKQPLVSMQNGTNIVFMMASEAGGQKQKFDIPLQWTNSPNNRPLLGIETYNSVSMAWEYQGGNAASSLLSWAQTITNHTIQGDLIIYTRYTYNGANRGNIQIRLKF